MVTRHWQLQEDSMAVASWANFDTLEWKGELSCAEGDLARLLFHFLMRPRLTNYCCKRETVRKRLLSFFLTLKTIPRSIIVKVNGKQAS